MHFIGMSSFKLMLEDTEIPIRFNLANLIYLLVVVLLMIFASVYVASTDDCFNRSTKEIMEKFITRACATYTMNELQHMGQLKIFYIVFTHSLHRTLAGGVIAGASVAIMHYVGMTGMEFQGEIKYDGGIVAASCITSMCVIISGYWIFFRVLSLFPSLDILRIICAANGMFGISGLHYIGLQAATFDYDPTAALPNPRNTVDRYQMLIGVITTAVLLSFLMLVYVLSDLRNWLLQTSSRLRHADLTIAAAHKQCKGRTGAYSQISRDTTRYLRKHVYKDMLPPGEDIFGEASMPRLLFNDLSDDDDDSSTGRTNTGGVSSGGNAANYISNSAAGAAETGEFGTHARGVGFRPEGDNSDDDFDALCKVGSIKTKPTVSDSNKQGATMLYPAKHNTVIPEPQQSNSGHFSLILSQVHSEGTTAANVDTEHTVSIV